MEYRVPTQDMKFVLNELAGLDEIISLTANDDLSTDLVDAVLDENARFVEQEIAPLNRKGDTHPAQCKDGHVTTSPGFQEAFAGFGQGGWQGLNHAAELGGQGLPKVVASCATESINGANLSFSLCPLLTDGVIEALAMVGSPEQQQLYIPPLVEGRWTGTMNLTEPQAGSDLAQVATRAVPQDDGTYRLSGQKIFITYGEHDMAENIVHLVLARTPDAPKGVKGISLFLVPKVLVNDDGSLGKRNDVWCASIEDKLGIHGSPTAELLYGSGKGEVGEGAVGYLIGKENEGLKYMFIMMNAARYAVGIQGIAVSEAALQQATSFAHERVQGQAVTGSDGPVTIAHHPDVQRMLLTMRALTEGGRALAYAAAAASDRARTHPDEAVRQSSQALYEYMVPVVKGFCTEAANEVTSLGIQVHGGMGYIEETGAAQFYRDARILPIYEGTTAIQANDLLGRKLVRDAGSVAAELVTQMRATLDEVKQASKQQGDNAQGLALIAQRFDEAINAYEQAGQYLLERAKSMLPASFLGSVPYLMLAGVTLSGWQMARAALACNQHITNQTATDFHRQKLATCVAHAGWVLPRAVAWNTSVQAGDALLPYADCV